MVALLLPTTRSNRRVHSGSYLLLGFSYSVYEWILYAKNHKLQLSIRQKAVLITTNFMFYTLPYRSFSISWPLAGNHLFTFINRFICTFLNNLTVFHNNDLITISNSAQSVCYYNACTPSAF